MNPWLAFVIGVATGAGVCVAVVAIWLGLTIEKAAEGD
jgi:hypothetical protein